MSRLCRPVRLLFTATKQQPPWRNTPRGSFFWGRGKGVSRGLAAARPACSTPLHSNQTATPMAGHAVQVVFWGKGKGVSRGLANSPLDCWLPGCGQAGLFDSSSQQPNSDPRGGTRHGGRCLEQVKGVEPSSSAWKADVLAVVRHLHSKMYYTQAWVHLSRYNGGFCTRAGVPLLRQHNKK